MNSTAKTIVFWVLIAVSAVLLWQLVVKAGGAGVAEREINFSEFMAQVDQGNIAEVTILGTEVRGKYRSENALFHTTVPANYPDMISILRDKNVVIKVKDVQGGGWASWLISFAPVLLLIALWVFMIRQMQMGGNKALSFGKSRARLLSMQQKKV
ncbi:MAG: ATP-dependent metallopeptidase FtsH/Yme1/Tma family protein, partial [Terriglobales bacterium]